MPVRKKTTKSPAAAKKEAAPKPARGLRRSYLWAALFTLLIAGWMLSGDLLGNSDTSGGPQGSTAVPGQETRAKPFRVRVKTYNAQTRNAVLTLRGRSEAFARVDIQAETAGIVEQLPVDKGSLVEKGSLVCKIETGVRQAMISKAKAEQRQAELDFEASERLMRQGHTAKLKVAEQQARLDAAKATMRQAELDLARTRIKAPFSGILEAQPAKVGDFLTVGETCATLVDLDPLKIVASVSEREVSMLKLGMTGNVKLVTGESVSGPIQFIATAADEKTRTFRIELNIDNKAGTLRDGVTADITIPLASDRAHKFSPALLSLNDDGVIGVRVIEGGDTVRFNPVRILSDDSDGVWVSGLPETVTVITVGQDYVTDGQKVEPVPDETRRSAGQ